MPTKKGFPTANVTVRCIDALDLIAERIGEKGIQIVQIPALARTIHEGV